MGDVRLPAGRKMPRERRARLSGQIQLLFSNLPRSKNKENPRIFLGKIPPHETKSKERYSSLKIRMAKGKFKNSPRWRIRKIVWMRLESE